MRRFWLLLPLMLLPACDPATLGVGLAAAGGAFIGYEKLKHPVGAMLTDNPAMAWWFIAKIASVIVSALILGHQAGKDHKNAD